MSTPLQLPAELTIYVAAELRSPWLAWLDSEAGDAEVACADGAAVEDIDAAGLQCLVALARSLAARQQRLRIDAASPALQQACRRLGALHLLAPTQGAAP